MAIGRGLLTWVGLGSSRGIWTWHLLCISAASCRVSAYDVDHAHRRCVTRRRGNIQVEPRRGRRSSVRGFGVLCRPIDPFVVDLPLSAMGRTGPRPVSVRRLGVGSDRLPGTREIEDTCRPRRRCRWSNARGGCPLDSCTHCDLPVGAGRCRSIASVVGGLLAGS